MAKDGRGYRSGAFALEVEGVIVGYIRKVDLGKLKGEVVTNNLGPTNRQKKHVARMMWDPMSFEVGMGMSKALVDWINSSFKMNHLRKNGAFIMFDHNYDVQRRCDFTDAHITEVSWNSVDAKGKESLYCNIKIQPETVRFTDGGGKLNPLVGAEQKLHTATNFTVDVPGVDAKFISNIEFPSFTVKVTEDARGEFLESQYVPTAVEVGDLKFTVGAQSYKQWYDDAMSFLVHGKRSETDEKTIAVNLKAPDGKTDTAILTFMNCGYREVQFAEAMEANKDAAANFVSSFYVEEMQLQILKSNA
jgi:hypothetical protein